MEKIKKEEARIIAELKNFYIVINTPAGQEYDAMTKGKIIDEKGVHRTGWIPLMTLMRDSEWKRIDEPYRKIFPIENRTAVDGVLGFAVGDGPPAIIRGSLSPRSFLFRGMPDFLSISSTLK